MREWEKCPLYKAYERQKRTVLRDIRKRNWLSKQEEELWRLILEAFGKINEPCADYWARRLHGYFKRRLRDCVKAEWVTIIAEFTDREAYGRYEQKKAKRYCCMVRDHARFTSFRRHKAPAAL